MKYDKNRHKTIPLHRYVIEQHLKRNLSIFEIVHHIDGDKQNNSLDNLKVMSRGEHNSLHGGDNKYNKMRHRSSNKNILQYSNNK